MKTELTPEVIRIAAKLVEEIGDNGINHYAEFMGFESIHSSELENLTVSEIAEKAEITIEESEVFFTALNLSDSPSLWGAFQQLTTISNL